MTDYSSKYAGQFTNLNHRFSCLLDEGAMTVGWSYDETGRRRISISRAAPIAEGMPVALVSTADCLYDACGGLPIVSLPLALLNADQSPEATIVVGKVVTFEQEGQNRPATTAAAATLAQRISGKYLRCAGIELIFGQKVEAVKVSTLSTLAVNPGDQGNLVLDMSLTATYGEPVYQIVADNLDASKPGSGVIPLHYVPEGSGDIYTCLVIYTGPTVAQA